jgi:hypothetical protein
MMRFRVSVSLLIALACAGLLSANAPEAPQDDVFALREQLQKAKTDLLAMKAQAQVFERRWRGCEAAADQDLQARLKPELDALQKAKEDLDAAKSAKKP